MPRRADFCCEDAKHSNCKRWVGEHEAVEVFVGNKSEFCVLFGIGCQGIGFVSDKSRQAQQRPRMKRDRQQTSASRRFHGEAGAAFAENIEAGRRPPCVNRQRGSVHTTVEERFSRASMSSLSAMNEEESKFTEELQNVCVAIVFTNLSQCMIPWIHALTCDASHMQVVETGLWNLSWINFESKNNFAFIMQTTANKIVVIVMAWCDLHLIDSAKSR